MSEKFLFHGGEEVLVVNFVRGRRKPKPLNWVGISGV
jgi:hypothetical protein